MVYINQIWEDEYKHKWKVINDYYYDTHWQHTSYLLQNIKTKEEKPIWRVSFEDDYKLIKDITEEEKLKQRKKGYKKGIHIESGDSVLIKKETERMYYFYREEDFDSGIQPIIVYSTYKKNIDLKR